MDSIRDQRLNNDHRELLRLQRQLNVEGQTKLQVRPQGRTPYQAYNLIFFCGGYVDDTGTAQRRHQLFLEFPRAYPLEAPPTFKRVSPLFHPNIYPHGVFCLGFEGERKWRPSISLESLILHVSRLIRFDPDWVNLNPPANRTAEFWGRFLKDFRTPVADDAFVSGEESESAWATPTESPVVRPAQPRVRPAIRIGPGQAGTRSGTDIREVPQRDGRRPIGPIRITRNNPNP